MRLAAWIAIGGGLAAAAGLLYLRLPRRPPGVLSQEATKAFAPPSACGACHAQIASSYRDTGMGRSFARASKAAEAIRDSRFRHTRSGREYIVEERQGRLYQRRAELDPPSGKPAWFEKAADYVIGSGNHCRSYLYRGANGRLYQLPLTWYAEKGGYWAMSPGYDHPDHQDFRRAITYDCIFCHNGYPSAPPAARPGDDPVFPQDQPEGIDCQRCHGPGLAHVEAASRGKPAEAIRAAILNPKRLSRDRQLEICMQCHLESTSRPLPYAIVRYDRGVFTYRAGEPLAEYILHFDHAAGAGFDDKFEIAHAAYRLRKSACFTRSDSLTCTTCHDPHRAPRGADAVKQYRAACQSCHPAAHRTVEDCASCHMPKRRTQDVVHVVMTDHYIQRHRPQRDLLAPIEEKTETESAAYRGEVRPYYPAEAMGLYYAAAQVMDRANLKEGIRLLESALAAGKPAEPQFYFELAEAYWKASESGKAITYYRETLRRQADHSSARRNLAVALRQTGDLSRAAAVLEPTSSDAEALATLGEIYNSLGKMDDAERVLRRALELDADNPEAQNNLGRTLARRGDRAGAIAAFSRALLIRPNYAAAHNNLANQAEADGDFQLARRHFERAIRHDPAYAEAYYNYGTALAARRLWSEAERRLSKAVELAPDFAEAHNNLGNLYAAQGQAAKAIASWRAAIRIAPSFGAARLNLALALASAGRRAEAVHELKQAAQTADPAIQQAARRALEELSR
jgi:tetratricopeptide (TPR) repeat protein